MIWPPLDPMTLRSSQSLSLHLASLTCRGQMCDPGDAQAIYYSGKRLAHMSSEGRLSPFESVFRGCTES